MSASPMAKAVESKSIPIKKVQIQDPSELPSHYSSTPGGTLFSTTPGGTKIVYEKSFLMTLRNSPIARTPPSCDIPEHLLIGGPNRRHSKGSVSNHQNSHRRDSLKKTNDHDEQFQIEL